MEVTIFMFSLTVGLVMSAGSSTFEPGCSFIGGQCMYNVKLGHAEQCDKVSSGGTSGGNTGCCDDLTNKYGSLVDDIDKLKIKVDLMAKAMDASNFTIAALEKDLANSLKERDDIVNVLNRKEKELTASKADIAKTMATSATEIQSLRDDLAKVKNSLQSCQTALGIGTGSITKGTTDDNDYNMTYYNFDKEPTGFKYDKNYMQLMKKGSENKTGPSVEHSRGVNSGNYFSINSKSISTMNANPVLTTHTAKSGTFLPADNYCIKFWYFMKGIDVQKLDVNIEIQSDTGYPIFSRDGQSKTYKWELAQISLNDEYTQFPFKISFVMTSTAYRRYNAKWVYHNSEGDIAVDDLYVYNTSCSSLPTYPDGAYQNTINYSTSYYTFHSTPKTWFDAYDYCRRQGPMSALVSIETKAEQAFLVNTIKNDVVLSAAGRNGFYTSGSDADSEHDFKWTNTGVQNKLDVSFWHLGQPNNVAGVQHCLLMEYPDDSYKWGDVECTTKHPFICETTTSG